MQVPVQVTFARVPVSRELEALAVGGACRLRRVSEKVRECHVTYGEPDDGCRVRVSVVVPGGGFVTRGGTGSGVRSLNAYLAAREAFESARRRLLACAAAGASGGAIGRREVGDIGRGAEGSRGRRAGGRAWGELEHPGERGEAVRDEGVER